MKTFCGIVVAVCLACMIAQPAGAAEGKLAIVAAENFYGDVARQIGGDRVDVKSIMSNPDQDPHLFETSPDVVRQIADAQLVIYNGVDYDPWMEKLIKASPRAGRIVVVTADLTGTKPGQNPHLWYDPATMPKVVKALAAALSKADTKYAADYAARLDRFLELLTQINEKIAAMAKKYGGASVTASEPVFGYMAEALKLKMRNERFQLAIMNDTEPSARDVAVFEQDLKTHKVRAMFYNKQASSKIVQHLVDLAHASKIPVVGVTETEPPNTTYQDWMMMELNDTEKALATSSS